MKENLFTEVELFFKNLSCLYAYRFDVLRPTSDFPLSCICVVEICNYGLSNILLSRIFRYSRSKNLDFYLSCSSSSNMLIMTFYKF